VDASQPVALKDNQSTQALVADLVAWSQAVMRRGQPLALRLPGRIGWELRLVVQGGLRIAEKIQRMDHCTMMRRPRLRSWDAPIILARAIAMGWRRNGPG